MKLVNTYISNDCTKKVLVYVDKNGHYNLRQFIEHVGFIEEVHYGRSKFKHIESAQRAIKKWIS